MEPRIMNNDNLNIVLSIEGHQISILKFSYGPLPANMPSHAHSSNSYEIHYIPQGHGTLYSRYKAYDLHPNVLCVTGPHVEHAQLIDPADPMYEYCIYLKVDRTGASQSNRPDPLLPILQYPFWYGTDNTRMPSVLCQICCELADPSCAAPLMLRALFLQFIACLLQNYDRTSKSVIASTSIPLVKAYILIEDSFLYEYATITMEELAARLGLSSRQVARILYNQYGKNFVLMRTEARMAAAAAFLRETALSVSDISAKVGYSCPSHFHAAFKKYYGETAARYRKRNTDTRRV